MWFVYTFLMASTLANFMKALFDKDDNEVFGDMMHCLLCVICIFIIWNR